MWKEIKGSLTHLKNSIESYSSGLEITFFSSFLSICYHRSLSSENLYSTSLSFPYITPCFMSS